MTITAHSELVQVRETMLGVLTEAAEHRHKREYVSGAGPDAELGWVLYEREQMTHAVNLARLKQGLPPLAMDVVRRAEQAAEGHFDYAGKFALYCAELALGIKGEQ